MRIDARIPKARLGSRYMRMVLAEQIHRIANVMNRLHRNVSCQEDGGLEWRTVCPSRSAKATRGQHRKRTISKIYVCVTQLQLLKGSYGTDSKCLLPFCAITPYNPLFQPKPANLQWTAKARNVSITIYPNVRESLQ